MAKKRRKPTKKPIRKKHILLAAKKRLILPRTAIAKPPSPFERRMSEFVFNIPPIGTPKAAHLQRLMEMDIGFQLHVKELQNRLPHLVRARVKGGSGLQLSKLLRFYFFEYLDRLFKHGPQSFPSSFNVIESFLSFDQKYMFFDLRKEIEHLYRSMITSFGTRMKRCRRPHAFSRTLWPTVQSTHMRW